MADQKISEMTTASTVSGSDVAPVVQGGANKKATMTVIKTFMAASPVYVGDNARFVAVPGPPAGVKLQCKNGSDVWEDIWAYVAST